LAGPDHPKEDVKIWGQATAAGSLAHSLSDRDLARGLKIVEDIRSAVPEMKIAIEGHARWSLPSAIRIARALEPFDILWLEEIMPPDNVEAYVRLKSETSVPICQSERLLSKYAFRPFIEQHAADIIMPDLSWCGGLTEGRKIAAMADTYYLPVTCHDTIGPVALIAASHLMHHIPNALIMETVRGYLDGWYQDVITGGVEVTDGVLTLSGAPGLGTALRPDLRERPGVRIEVSDNPLIH